MNTQRSVIECVKEQCKFELVSLHVNNKSISQIINFLPTINNLYVCMQHFVFHLCCKEMELSTCIFLAKKAQHCPISNIQNNNNVRINYPKQKLVQYTAHSESWETLLSEYHFSQCLQQHVATHNLQCDPHILNSILQRLYVLYMIYYRSDQNQSQFRAEVIFSNCKTRMYYLQELLSEHFNPEYVDVLRGRKLAEIKFLKQAARLVSYDLMVEKSQLLPVKVLTDPFVDKPIRKRIFERWEQTGYWRTETQSKKKSKCFLKN